MRPLGLLPDQRQLVAICRALWAARWNCLLCRAPQRGDVGSWDFNSAECLRAEGVWRAIDHERVTHNYAGGDFRLTDVHGDVVREILA